MKRKLHFFVSILATVILCVFCLTSCGGSDKVKANVTESTENLLVLTVQETDGQATLLNAMEALQTQGKISFEISSGMIVKIGEVSNTASSYWMLYTSDEEMANTAWGIYEYEGKALGSAILGADALPVKEDAIYIWVYETPEW